MKFNYWQLLQQNVRYYMLIEVLKVSQVVGNKMQTKLHINLSQGIIDVEGDVELVREVYSDFRGRLLSGDLDASAGKQTVEASQSKAQSSTKSKKRSNSNKSTQTETGGDGIDPRNPKLDKNIDLSTLPAFFNQFEPKNIPEKILIFAKFLIDEAGINKPNTDQIYSCFVELKEKIPTAFDQSFRDAQGRKHGFIDYNSANDIGIPIKGTNHFNDGIKRKTDG